MKTKTWVSVLLTACLVLPLAASLFLTAGAEDVKAWNPSQMPNELPDNSAVTRQNLWVNFATDGVWGDEHEIDADGFVTVAQAASGHAVVQGNKSSTYKGTSQWRGASGVMFYVDASQGPNVNFNFSVQVGLNRFNSAGQNKFIKFAPRGTNSVAYYYQSGVWKSFTASGTTGNYLESKAKVSGWYFIPLTSLYYAGGSGTLYNGDLATEKNLVEFMEFSSEPNILRPLIQCGAGIRFNSIYFVYTNAESSVISDTGAVYATSESPLFGKMTRGGVAGTGTLSVSDNVATVGGLTENSSTGRAGSVWMGGLNGSLLTKDADGIRFQVDTTALPDGERLQMRFKLLTSTKINAYSDFLYGTGNTMTTIDGNNVQYFLRGDNSVAYYFDEDGNPVALHTCANVASNKEGDLLDALPENYKGEIYLPFTSIWMSINAYSGLDIVIPFMEVIDKFPVHTLAIDHAIAGKTEAESARTVVYSDFEVVSVYKDTRISGVSVTLQNDLNLNFFATLQNGATNGKMTMNGQEVEGASEDDGSIRYVCEGILPQLINDKVIAVLTAEVGGKTVSQTMEYSVADYCMDILADGTSSNELKTLVVDMLYYGAEAQRFANYRIDAPATGRLNAQQQALRSIDTTGIILSTMKKTGTADNSYDWKRAALRLEDTAALNVQFSAASLDDLIVVVSVSDRTVTVTEFTAVGNNEYGFIFDDIMASEYDNPVTFRIMKGDSQIGQTLTYSVASYIARALEKDETTESEASLLRAMYAYGVSVKVYAASVA